jgi:hypothetical protein
VLSDRETAVDVGRGIEIDGTIARSAGCDLERSVLLGHGDTLGKSPAVGFGRILAVALAGEEYECPRVVGDILEVNCSALTDGYRLVAGVGECCPESRRLF